MKTLEECMALRHGTCAGFTHDWSSFDGLYPDTASEQIAAMPPKTLQMVQERILPGHPSQPWKTCNRCGELITWDEWHAAYNLGLTEDP
jgi:hypothetical protein